ncbi:MAG: hypothetical protein AABY43_06210 [Candidatus Omnitrophota bacterium]
MKKIYLIIFVITLVLTPISLFAQQEAASDPQEGNAAVYYTKAMELLKFPDPAQRPEIFKRIAEIMEKGWQEEDKDVEEILQQSEPSLKEFSNGILLKQCDFTFGKKYEYLIDEPIPSLLKIRELTELVILKGRWYEKNGEFNKATDEYLSLLRFSWHISEGKGLLFKMMGVAAERDACIPLKQYLNSNIAQKQNCLKISNHLSDHNKKHFLIEELYMNEKEIFLSKIRKGIDIDEVNNFSNSLLKSKYHREFLKQGEELAGNTLSC